MKKTVERLARQMPRTNGFALHGTPYRNVPSIRKEGLTAQYVSKIPGREMQLPTREVLQRTIGSILFAQTYGYRFKSRDGLENAPTRFGNPDARAVDMPALVVFGNGHYLQYRGYDHEDAQKRIHPSPHRVYESFGKDRYTLPPSSVLGVVRLTLKEHRELLALAKAKSPTNRNEQYAEFNRRVTAHLVVKTLQKLRSLIESGALGEKK